jgi:hypothetical protein
VASPIAIDVSRSAQADDALWRAKLDRFGYLDQKCRAAKPDLKERDDLRTEIQEKYKDEPALKPKRVSGNLYYVDLSICESQRKITCKSKAFAALRRALGVTRLAEALSYTLKLLDEHVPVEKQKAFVSTAATGPRDVSAVLIAPPAA